MVNGYVPVDLHAALDIKAKHDVVPYAGGTDLMVENRTGVSYLFLGKLDELRQIKEDENYIRIGAAVTFTEALASDLVPQLMKDNTVSATAPKAALKRHILPSASRLSKPAKDTREMAKALRPPTFS